MADSSPVKVSLTSNPSSTGAAGKKATKAPIQGIKSAHDDLLLWLYSSHGALVDAHLQKMEQSTGLKREQLTYAFGGLMVVYMILGGAAQFVSNLIGFAYPAYASVKAVRTEGKDDDSQWLMYWTVFAAFFLVDALVACVFSWFPFYFLLKSLFLVFLYLPQTQGAEYLYQTVVDPAVTYIDKLIQQYA